MLKIVTDSTCNLPEEQLHRYDIRVTPITVHFGMESYTEGVDIDHDLFFGKIEEVGKLPTTSQPSPAAFARHYRELTEQGHSILCITITAEHSGTYQSAVLARDLVPEADVEVFDSASISLGMGYMVLEAARAAEAGQSREAILKRLAGIRSRASLVFTPATVKFLQMSGRVGGLQAALASVLNIKPIISVDDGVMHSRERVRTRRKALDRLLAITEEAVGTTDPINVGVLHARAADEAQALLDRVRTTLNCRETMIVDLVVSLCVHAGPGVVGLFAYRV